MEQDNSDRTSRVPVVDSHSHVLPVPMLDHIERIGGPPALGWSPNLPDWSLPNHLEFMDRWGIDASVVTITTPAVALPVSASERSAVSRDVNDFMAEELVGQHPSRFAAAAMLPLPDLDASIYEAQRALANPAIDAISVLTSYAGTHLGDPRWNPLWELLDATHAVVMVHPTTPSNWPQVHAFGGSSLMDFVLEYPFETARTLTSLIYSAVLSRYPNIDWVFCHGGGAFPAVAFRVGALHAFDPGFDEQVPGGPASKLSNVYFDTAQAFGEAQISASLDLIGEHNLVFGTDWYAVAAMYDGPRPLAVKPADRPAVGAHGRLDPAPAITRLRPETRSLVLGANALNLFPRLKGEYTRRAVVTATTPNASVSEHRSNVRQADMKEVLADDVSC